MLWRGKWVLKNVLFVGKTFVSGSKNMSAETSWMDYHQSVSYMQISYIHIYISICWIYNIYRLILPHPLKAAEKREREIQVVKDWMRCVTWRQKSLLFFFRARARFIKISPEHRWMDWEPLDIQRANLFSIMLKSLPRVSRADRLNIF